MLHAQKSQAQALQQQQQKHQKQLSQLQDAKDKLASHVAVLEEQLRLAGLDIDRLKGGADEGTATIVPPDVRLMAAWPSSASLLCWPPSDISCMQVTTPTVPNPDGVDVRSSAAQPVLSSCI